LTAMEDDARSWLDGNSLAMAELPSPETTQRLILCLRDDTVINKRKLGVRGSSRQALVIIIQQLNFAENPTSLATDIAYWRAFKGPVYIVLTGGTLLRRQVNWCEQLDFVTTSEPPILQLLLSIVAEMLLVGNGVFWRVGRRLFRTLRR
ncbi:hypothetical protein INF70_22200, partial [Enterobacter cloacae complex sp. P4RS]